MVFHSIGESSRSSPVPPHVGHSISIISGGVGPGRLSNGRGAFEDRGEAVRATQPGARNIDRRSRRHRSVGCQTRQRMQKKAPRRAGQVPLARLRQQAGLFCQSADGRLKRFTVVTVKLEKPSGFSEWDINQSINIPTFFS